MKVDFFIIGAPKCGTTAMAQYLKENREICFSSSKETNFFCSEEFPLDSHLSNIDSYHKGYFSNYNETHTCVGEGSAYYLNSKYAVSRIINYNPEAKFIVMCRNPVQMVKSWHREMLRWFIENEDDFLTAWNLQETRSAGKNIPSGCRQPSGLQYKEVCSVGRHVKRVLSNVSRERVHIIFFEDFVADTKESYEATCEFLGVESGNRTDFNPVHTAKVWRSKNVRDLYNSAYLFKIAVLGRRPILGNLDAKLKYIMGAFIKPKVKGFSSDLDMMLRSEFAADISLLGRLTGRDLSGWTKECENN